MAESVELMPFESRHGRTLARMPDLREQRDPTGATRPLRWVSPGMPMVAEWDADQAVRYGYMANVIAFRCVQIIANTIAGLAFRAGPSVDTPQLHNPQAPLARLLGPAPGGPAKNLSARKLFAWSVAQRIVTGRWAWELETTEARGKGGIVAIWPLVSANLQALPTESGSDWFRAFRYGRNDNPAELTPGQVFYTWDPSLTDFRQPESALQALRYDLSLAVMADRYSLSFLKNGAVPAAVVTTTPFADGASRKRFRSQWNAQYQGPDNAGVTAFHEAEPQNGMDGQGKIADAIDVKVLGLKQSDAQFVEQHKESLSRIAIGLGVPWSRMDASGRTYDNAGAEDIIFWEQTILPRLLTYQDEINMELAPRLGAEVGWFDISKVRALRNHLIKPTDLPALADRKIIVVDEARHVLGLDPLPNGQGVGFAEPPPPNTAINVGGPSAPPELPPAPRALPRVPEPRRDSGRRRGVARPPVRLVAPVETRALTPEQQEQRRSRLWNATDRQARTLEQLWERAFRRLFAKQLEASLRRLTGKRGRQSSQRSDASQVFDVDYWSGQTAELAADLYESVAATAVARLTDQFAVDFTLDNPRMRDFLSARANQLAGQVTTTTYDQIVRAMSEGTIAGETLDEIAARIRHVFDVADTARSVTIARTEVISAYNGATAEFAAEVGTDVVGGQEWIATRDGRTREDHAGADGQVVVGVGPFDVGGEQLEYPGDPNGSPDNIINCRCALALLTPEDVAGLDDTGRDVGLGEARLLLSLATHLDERQLRAAIRKVPA